MPFIMGGVGIAAPIVGGLVGQAMSSGDRDAAQQAQQQALAAILGVNTPDIEKMKLALQNYQSAGQLSPEMEQQVSLGPSAMGSISTDPRAAAAQMQALSRLQQVGVSGLQPSDLAALNKITNNVSQQEQANEQSILQNMQQRGQGGSGAELAARLNSAQASANRASDQGMQVGGLASQNALQAILNSGQLGGQIQQQQFGEQSQQAQAADAIARYNAMNGQQLGNQNVALKNSAQAQNLSNAQNIMNANTGLANQSAQYNSQLQQLQYQDQMQKAQAQANAQNNSANQALQRAGQTQQMWGGIGQGVGQGASAVGNISMQQAGQQQANQQHNDYMKLLLAKQNPSAVPQAVDFTPSKDNVMGTG